METKETKLVNSPKSEPLPKYVDAFTEALLIDLPTYAILGANPITGLVGATVAYSVRKYCNAYLDDALDSNIMSQRLLKAAVCGGVGGALKYGIAGTTLAIPKLALGAYNNFMYEAFGPGKVCASPICTYADAIGIEASEGIVENIFNAYSGSPLTISPIVGGVKAGTLVASFVYSSYSLFSGNVTDTYKSLAGYPEKSIDDIYTPFSGDYNTCPLEQIFYFNSSLVEQKNEL